MKKSGPWKPKAICKAGEFNFIPQLTSLIKASILHNPIVQHVAKACHSGRYDRLRSA